MATISQLNADLSSRFSCLASTDLVGLFGNFLHSYQLYNSALVQVLGRIPLRPIGLEVLLFQQVMLSQRKILAKNLDKVGGFHGRIGPSQKSLRQKLLNNSFISTKSAFHSLEKLTSGQSHQYYLNLHDREAHYEPNLSSYSATNILLLRETEPGFPKGPGPRVFDILHELQDINRSNPISGWEIMLERLNSTSQCIIHLPLGRRDNLDTSHISISMWQELALLVSQTNSFITIESQFEIKWQIYSHKIFRPDLLPHIRSRLELMIRHGLLKC